MSSNYPSSLDNATSLPTLYDKINEVVAANPNMLRDAIINIETALGIRPQGNTYADVVSRLNAVDASILTINTSLSTILSEIDGYLSGQNGELINATDPTTSDYQRFNTGLTQYNATTKITDVLVSINDTLKYLTPATAASMSGLALDTVVSTFTGLLASQSGASYNSGQGAGTSVNYIITNPTFSVNTHNTGFSDADKGILTALINGATTSTFDMGVAYDPAFATTQQGSTYDGGNGIPVSTLDSKLTIQSVQEFNNFPLWQRGAATINAASLRSGYNSFGLTHTVGSDQRNSAVKQFWYDNRGAVRPSVSTPTLSANATTSYFLSGVKYLATSSSVQFGATITNPFVNVYIDPPLSYSFSVGMGVPAATMSLSDGSLSGFSNPPVSTEHITINKAFTITTANQQSISTNSSNATTISAQASVVFSNPYSETYTGTSVNQNILINTYASPVSTDRQEFFIDENYRLPVAAYSTVPGAITGQWTSATALSNGNAQCYGAALIFGGTNYSTGFAPSQSVNYSSFSGGQVYYRAIRDTSNPHSNGVLQLNGLGVGDIASPGDIYYTGAQNVKIELKVPGVTAWLDVGKSFDPSTFNANIMVDGTGCRSPSAPVGTSQFGYSFGTGSTGAGGNMYIIRITMLTRLKALTGFAEIGW